jgi:hypothetical protein
MEIPSMKRSLSGSLTIQFTSAILQGEIVQLTLQPSHSTAPLFLHFAQPLPACTPNTVHKIPKLNPELTQNTESSLYGGHGNSGKYSHFLTHQTAKEDSQKTGKKKKKLNYLPYRFWFRPNPEESSDSHHRISRTSRAVQQARLDVQASGWE